MIFKLSNGPRPPLRRHRLSQGQSQTARSDRGGGKSKLGSRPEWALADLYDGPDSPKLRPISRPPSAPPRRCRSLCRQARVGARWRQRRRAARASGTRVRGAQRYHGAHRVLCSRFTPRHLDPKRQNSSATSRRRSPPSPRSCVLPARAQPARRRRARDGVGQFRARPLRPWLEDLRKEKPYQLDDKLEVVPREGGDVARAWIGCQRDMTALDSRPTARAQPEPTLTACSIRTGRSAARPPRLWPRCSSQCALFTMITNTLAKDKEIPTAARVRRRRRFPQPGQWVEKEVVDRGRRGAQPILASRIATTR